MHGPENSRSEIGAVLAVVQARKGGVAARGALPRCMLPYSAEKRTQAMEQGLLKPAGSTKLEETALPFTGR